MKNHYNTWLHQNERLHNKNIKYKNIKKRRPSHFTRKKKRVRWSASYFNNVVVFFTVLAPTLVKAELALLSYINTSISSSTEMA